MSQEHPRPASKPEETAPSRDFPAVAGELHLLDDPVEWDSFGKPLAAVPGQSYVPQDVEVWDSHIALDGMYCATCALTIEDALRAVPGVERAEVSAAAKRARVVWRPAMVLPSQWMAAVQKAGYKAFPARDAVAREIRLAQHRKALWRWLLATFCMMQVMMYAWPAYDAQPGDLLMEFERLLRWASWVICIPMLIFACGPFFSGAWRDLRRRRVSMDLPVALGMIITFIVSTIGTFAPEGIFGQEVFYDSLTMFVSFLLAGRWLEVRLRDRTAGALDAVLNRLPDSVEKRQADGSFERVALRRIATGDVLRILPGEAFPVDGVIVRGRTQADEALLTGESRPVSRAEGERVIAGSYNLTAPVELRVDRVGAQTKFAQIVELMESASTQKPRLAQLADKVAGPFLVVVLGLALLSAVYWWPTDPGHALMIAAAVLIVTCPCALSLATPVAMLTAAGTLARNGILVRNLQGIEALATADTLVFDKTGTLTRDGLQVARMAVGTAGDERVLQGLAAAVAQQSRHPVSRAVASFGQAWVHKWQVLEVEELAGQGLRACVQPAGAAQPAVWVRLGSHAYAGAPGVVQAGQAVYLAQEVQPSLLTPLAGFELSEGLRAEAAAVVAAMRRSGLHVQLLSGDGPQAVARIAQEVGIGDFVAECSPQSKLAHIRAMQEDGRHIAMVGDGLNDGPVLAGANVSFAFGRAVPLAQARSDFVVLSDNLELVWQAVLLARKTLRVVRQNLLGSALYNALSIPLAMAGWMPAWLAGLGMALSSLLVVLNAARLAKPVPLQSAAPQGSPVPPSMPATA
ncbi:cation-translocating P-type ATPase [Comamonas aquatica]|uniref:heavy metal translocating P-type ATPase n=1 Tax=Comamonas aquatica TaxID=225991 RepID=UPI00244C4678|nr:cation-translocating P-type ATPase [Comamonas aquatica]MDH0371243.1 cation-translocating P-type ATPase [Comamonas aquatica]